MSSPRIQPEFHGDRAGEGTVGQRPPVPDVQAPTVFGDNRKVTGKVNGRHYVIARSIDAIQRPTPPSVLGRTPNAYSHVIAGCHLRDAVIRLLPSGIDTDCGHWSERARKAGSESL